MTDLCLLLQLQGIDKFPEWENRGFCLRLLNVFIPPSRDIIDVVYHAVTLLSVAVSSLQMRVAILFLFCDERKYSPLCNCF